MSPVNSITWPWGSSRTVMRSMSPRRMSAASVRASGSLETPEFGEAEDVSEEERRAATESWNRREIKDYPNLLELSKSVLRTVMLQVHYRSAYRELIAFSNNPGSFSAQQEE
jgi:hypothetical protein